MPFLGGHTPTRGKMNPGAFQGAMPCKYIDFAGNFCLADSWEYVENVGPCRIRYRCRKCKRTIIYDFSNNPSHPYATYGKNKWRQIVEAWKATKGKHPRA